ncbi:hypothetical protein MLD38_020784 [Melastoma candidum]|uniref:Uncharacterized protein n=1 Tax=Melastoma candidum TaxID=119954 RepID=A0ACB9QH96_9MYRT|nr:hypothetical protein MLD38_020784 [Melastoma candidum]
MSGEMQKLIGASEEDEEDDMEDVKEEDDDDDEDEEKQMSMSAIVGVDGVIRSNCGRNFSRVQSKLQMEEQAGTPGSGGRRCRPLEEKERTKLRERNRRAITARILAGLRRHGNYNLRVRADINDVIAALAREAGWVVLPDGTTFPSRSQCAGPAVGCSSVETSSPSKMVPQATQPTPVEGISSCPQNLPDYNASQMKNIFLPNASLYDLPKAGLLASNIAEVGGLNLISAHVLSGMGDAADSLPIANTAVKLPEVERDFTGSAFIPVYVMLPLGVINVKCELVDPDSLLKQLRSLKAINVDGVSVDCWWGIVEALNPLEYNWNGYRRLFQMVSEMNFKLQVFMSFHECGGNVGDDVCIPLPHWVTEIGRSNPNIFFTDREGRHNKECLSWGVDRERILGGRTALEVYFDYMRSFRVEFSDYFEAGLFSVVVVGLGPCGELRYPSHPVKHGWRYPGIGEFQCYDQYMLKNLRNTAEAKRQSFWARGPDNTGSYNSRPEETGFFCDGGDYDGYFGRFFLKWYSQVLIDHGDRVFALAKLVFEGTFIAAKLPGIYWWYRSASHAAELTAGFYNPSNRDGYASIAAMLKKHGVALYFSCPRLPDQQGDFSNAAADFSNAAADSKGLAWQLVNAVWDVDILIAGENSFPCHDRSTYNRILEESKPLNNPFGNHFWSYTYQRLNSLLMERHNLSEFERFIKRMHGEAVVDFQQ